MLDIVMYKVLFPVSAMLRDLHLAWGDYVMLFIRFMYSLKYYKIYQGFLVKYAGLVAMIHNMRVLHRKCLPFRRTLTHCIKWVFLTSGIHVVFCLIYFILILVMLHSYCVALFNRIIIIPIILYLTFVFSFKHMLLFNKKQLDRTQVSQLRNVFSKTFVFCHCPTNFTRFQKFNIYYYKCSNLKAP